MWTPEQHQIAVALEGYQILRDNMIVYLAMEERTGKTLTSLLIAEMCSGVDTVLVISTKEGRAGWHECLANYRCSKSVTVTNYHQASKQPKHDLVILDESHNYITAYPKPSAMVKTLKKLTLKTPLIYLSATPHAQSYSQLYHAFSLSSWSPWARYSSFYRWFDDYGIPETEYIAGRPITKYNKTKTEKVLADIDLLVLTRTRQEIGFIQEPTDKIHYIQLKQITREVYNDTQETKTIILPDDEISILDSSMKLRTTLHMLEGGTAKRTTVALNTEGKPVILAKYLVFSNTEKVDYIKATWGDTDNLCIMYHYKAEKIKLEHHFKKARILQATTFAEGVDLHHIEHLVIYSMDFRTAKYSQRRARQANRKRNTPITVHFLLVAGAISEQVYVTVALNKQNFIDSTYQRNYI